jgi:hypothetical protein
MFSKDLLIFRHKKSGGKVLNIFSELSKKPDPDLVSFRTHANGEYATAASFN